MAKQELIVKQISESVAQQIGLNPSTIEESLDALLDIKNLLSKMIDPNKTVQQDQKFPFVFTKTFENVLNNLKETSSNFKSFSKIQTKTDSNTFFEAITKIPSKIEEKISNKVKDVAYNFVPEAIKSKVLSFTDTEQKEKIKPVEVKSVNAKEENSKQTKKITESVVPTEVKADLEVVPSIISKGFESILKIIDSKSIENNSSKEETLKPVEVKSVNAKEENSKQTKKITESVVPTEVKADLEVVPSIISKGFESILKIIDSKSIENNSSKEETLKPSVTENKLLLVGNSINKHFNQIEKTLVDVKKILTETNVNLNSQPSELEKLAIVQSVKIDSFNKQALIQMREIFSKMFSVSTNDTTKKTEGPSVTGGVVSGLGIKWLLDKVLGTTEKKAVEEAAKAAEKKAAEEAAKAAEKKGVEVVEKKVVEAVEKKGVEVVEKKVVEAVEKKGVEAVEKKGVEAVEKQLIKTAEKGLVSQIASKAAAAAKPASLLKGGANILKGGAVGLATDMALEAAIPEANKETYLGQALNEFRSFGIATTSGAAGGAATGGLAGAVTGAVAGASIDVGSKLYKGGKGLYDLSKINLDNAQQEKDYIANKQSMDEQAAAMEKLWKSKGYDSFSNFKAAIRAGKETPVKWNETEKKYADWDNTKKQFVKTDTPAVPKILPEPLKNEIENPTQWTKINQPTDVATQLIKAETPGNFISIQPSSFDGQIKDFNLSKGIENSSTSLLSNPEITPAKLYDNMKDSVNSADQNKAIQSKTTENKLKDTVDSTKSDINNEALKQTATESTKQTQLLSMLVGNMNENFGRIASAFREAGINFKEIKTPVVVQQNSTQNSPDKPNSSRYANLGNSEISNFRLNTVENYRFEAA